MRLSWAKRLKRVFDLDREHCPHCGGELKIIAAILEQAVIEKILTHLGLQARAPPRAPPVGRSCKRPDRLFPSPLRRRRAPSAGLRGCGDRLRPGFMAPWIAALLHGQTLGCRLRTTHFRAAADPQRAAVEPKDHLVDVWQGPWGEKMRLNFLSSKAAVLTHGQMGFVVTNHLVDLIPGTDERDCSIAVAPLSHGAGIHALLNVARGAATVLLPSEKLAPESVWQLVEEHRVTNLFTVPTIVKMLVEHPAIDQYDHSSLRFMVYAGAPMYRADQRLALQKLGPVLVQYFGLGEVTGCITVLPAHRHSADDASPNANIGACGKPRTGMEVAVLDRDLNPVATSEVGEICCRGPAVFAGHHNNPAATAKALRGGCFHTGDLGRLDRRGLLYITGRESDRDISGGSNVYPREAEEVLLSHPGVAEAAVLGVPDRHWGEVGVAVVVRRSSTADPLAPPLDEASLLAFLDGRLARYRWPRQVFFWDALPKSGYGKITKKDVLRMLIERGEVQPVQSD